MPVAPRTAVTTVRAREPGGPCHLVVVGTGTVLCGIELPPARLRNLHSRLNCPRSNGGPCANTCANCLLVAKEQGLL